MAEYIEREAALDCFACDLGKKDYAVSYQGFMTEAAFRINGIPAADVVPVRHGRWIFGTTMHHDWMKCSECLVSQDLNGCFSYCPNCGAKMDKEEE